MTNARDIVSAGLRELNLTTPLEPLLDYLFLLAKWNSHYNLTAVRDIETMATRHILDSLAVAPWLNGPRLLDSGTGAGLPGIPLALNNPQLKVVLLDSNGKKIRFLEAVKRQLAIANIDIVQTRVESYHPAEGFDTVISRAFTEVAQMIKWTRHLINTNGIWLAMKGRNPKTELTGISFPYQIRHYKVPGLEAERCCVIIENIMTKD